MNPIKIYIVVLFACLIYGKAFALSPSGEYIWYPGQLSAHLQQKRLEESRERCVNVGYPGNFYAPAFQTFFRKKVNLSSETHIEWASTGNVKLSVDGKNTNYTRNQIQLPKGKHTLLFDVKSADNLPSIKVSFDGKSDVDSWQASLD